MASGEQPDPDTERIVEATDDPEAEVDMIVVAGEANNNDPKAAETLELDDGLPPIGERSPANASQCYLYTFNYFKRSEDLLTATCRLCQYNNEKKGAKLKTVFKTTNQGTKGIWGHFETKHPDLHKSLKEVEKEDQAKQESLKPKKGDGTKQQKLVTVNNQIQVELPPEIDQATQARWDDAVILFAAETLCSFRMLEKLSILLQALWPNGRWKVKVKSRHTVSRQVTNIATTIFKDIQNIVFSTEDLGGVGSTSDLWKNKSNDSFMCMTLHLITSDMELWMFVPFVSYFGDQQHSGENIKDKMLDYLKKLGLDTTDVRKYLTMDTARNNQTAQRKMVETEEVWCIIHVAMLCIKDVLKLTVGRTKIAVILQKCQDLAVAIRGRESKENELKKACKETDTGYIRVIMANKTRFNSTRDNIASCLRLKKPLQHLLNTDLDGFWSGLILTPFEFELAACLLETLEVVKTATKRWEIDTSPTIHLAIQELFNIVEKLTSLKADSPNWNIRLFATRLLKAFNQRFPSCGTRNNLYRLGHLLDPAAKGVILMEFNCYDETVAELKEMMRRYARKQSRAEQSNETPAAAAATVEPETAATGEVELTGYQKLLKRRRMNSGEANTVPAAGNALDAKIDEELTMFLNLEVTDEEAQDVLGFYRKRIGTFKYLIPVVREIFCIPVSSSSSERAFSIGTQICSPRRSMLSQDKIEQLMVIKLNSERLETYKKTHKIKPAVLNVNQEQEEVVVDLEAAQEVEEVAEEEEENDEEVVWVNENEEGVYQEMMEFVNTDEDDYGDLPPLVPQQRK